MNIAWERISLLMSCNMFLFEMMPELFFNIIIYQLWDFFFIILLTYLSSIVHDKSEE